MNRPSNLQLSLLLMRMSIFVVMLMWTIDKIINPSHSAKVFEKFYFIAGLENSIMSIIGLIELVILTAFILGVYKRFSYGAVLIFHTVSTWSSYQQYMSPFEGSHLLFFAAWPMLAGCLMLYLLREDDNLWALQ